MCGEIFGVDDNRKKCVHATREIFHSIWQFSKETWVKVDQVYEHIVPNKDRSLCPQAI